MHKNVLYVGSGPSALQIHDKDISNLHVCAVNNAWRLLPDDGIWIHSGDFPFECRTKDIPDDRRVSHSKYSVAAREVCAHLKEDAKSPEHHLGYTIFFMGLYWIAWALKPKRIYLLGFDHDYAPQKVARWREGGMPTPQNQFRKPAEQSIKDWSEEFFAGMPQDFFYGHGTPDPLRLGEKHLTHLFDRAAKLLPKLGVECLNLSGVTTGLNTFPQADGIS